MSACHAAFSALLLLVAAVACGRSSSSATPPDNNEDAPLVRTCEEVQMRCAQRKGCGSALHAYLYQCNEVIQAGASQCPVPCQRALAALTSTDEGRGLSDCECGENDVCRKSKLRVEVCREAVEKLTAPGARIPCSVAFLDVRGRAPVRHGARLLLPLLPLARSTASGARRVATIAWPSSTGSRDRTRYVRATATAPRIFPVKRSATGQTSCVTAGRNRRRHPSPVLREPLCIRPGGPS
ncbi:hypothetical protein HPB52_020878 [Rhipicephalus sanguineus]|uniref:Growth arrest-specific protein 1 n=1 Tax=Rhipicephalus sanguineus TaxID=34632 RepID=A0A9D4Q2H2_RHISA|nr:hypothetical protein HPB52_020878 [Rhipicephalus sanguineus]